MKEVIGILGVGNDLGLMKISLPAPGASQILIRVAFAGINRADVEQSQGQYPPPPGSSPILGLECSGFVEAVGSAVTGFKVGDPVMALLTGGAFADFVIADTECVLPIPSFMSLRDAAALPESLFTFWANSRIDGNLETGKTFLVHGGASGLGSFAIQMAKAMGCVCFSSARGEARTQFAQSCGASTVVNTQGLSTAETCEKLVSTFGISSVDIIMDHLGADYLEAHLKIAKKLGRIILINSVTGDRGSLNYDDLIVKRIQLIGSVLRSRPLGEKKNIRDSIAQFAMPVIEKSKLSPRIDCEYAITDFKKAFEKIIARENMGKILFSLNP